MWVPESTSCTRSSYDFHPVCVLKRNSFPLPSSSVDGGGGKGVPYLDQKLQFCSFVKVMDHTAFGSVFPSCSINSLLLLEMWRMAAGSILSTFVRWVWILVLLVGAW